MKQAAGFTLIEVMIAITVMAVLSVISWRALDSVSRSEEHLRAVDAETADALRVLQQFQRDIEMRADDALMNGAVRPADKPQRLLPPSLASERFPDGGFAIEITRTVGSQEQQWQRVRWWTHGGRLLRASGVPGAYYPLPSPDPGQALQLATDVQQFDVRAWQPGAGWMLLPSQGEALPATGIELQLDIGGGRVPRHYRRVLGL